MKKLSFVLCLISILLLQISCASVDVYDNESVSLIQDSSVLSTEKHSFKNGREKKNKAVVASKSAVDGGNDQGQNSLEKTSEKITVESAPNGKYIAYTFFGKPFVILGSTAWELLKCCGYSCVNFLGGYNLATGGETFWIIPDVNGNFEKYHKAIDENKIKVYPEYHKPFTDNKISVSKITYSAGTVTTNEDEMTVTSSENYEYDNTLSVKKSVSADAHATYGVVGIIGTAITVPVSALTWILGLAYGIAEDVK